MFLPTSQFARAASTCAKSMIGVPRQHSSLLHFEVVLSLIFATGLVILEALVRGRTSPAFLPTSCLSVLTPWSHGRPFRTYRFVFACLSSMLVAGVSHRLRNRPFFETEIRPILREYCFDCHGAVEEMEGGLDLRLVHLMISGGDSGSALVPGNPEESLLLTRVRDGDMPPGETRVSDDKIAVLEHWIRRGAPTRRAEPNKSDRASRSQKKNATTGRIGRSFARSADSGRRQQHPKADRRIAR